MFSFQSDVDLPNGNFVITFIIALLLSFIHSPDIISRPLTSLREVVTNLVFHCMGIEGPAHTIPERSVTEPHEQRRSSVIPAHTTSDAPTSRTGTPTPHDIIRQVIPNGAGQTIVLISAVDDITMRITIQHFLRININNIVHADEHEHPNTHLTNLDQTNTLRLQIRRTLDSLAVSEVPDEVIMDKALRTTRALKSEVLNAMTSTPPCSHNNHLINTIQGALGSFRLSSTETTQRDLVRYLRGVRTWVVHGLSNVRARVRPGEGQGDEGAGRDIEMGYAVNNEENELSSWVKHMTREVVQEMRAICEIIPPEGREYGAEGAPGEGWRIKLKDNRD